MNARVDQLLNEALSLPETERVALADALYASVDAPLEDPAEVEAAWDSEIARRADEVRAGKAKLIPLDEVRSNLEATIRRVQGR
jgi:putative addiction module component (TIGR02574 family)